MTEQQPPLPAPGWYPDGRGAVRYWDGNAWTQHVQPPPSTPAAPAQPATPAAPDAPTSAAPAAAAGAAGGAAAGAAAGQHGAGPVAHEPPLHEIEEAQLGQTMPMAGGATIPASPESTAVMPTVGAETVETTRTTDEPERKPFYKSVWLMLSLLLLLVVLAVAAAYLLTKDDDDDGGTVNPVVTPTASAAPTAGISSVPVVTPTAAISSVPVVTPTASVPVPSVTATVPVPTATVVPTVSPAITP